jgi:hypothetical protein
MSLEIRPGGIAGSSRGTSSAAGTVGTRAGRLERNNSNSPR